VRPLKLSPCKGLRLSYLSKWTPCGVGPWVEETKYSNERGPNHRAVDDSESKLTEGESKNDRVRTKFERIAKVLITMKVRHGHATTYLRPRHTTRPF